MNKDPASLIDDYLDGQLALAELQASLRALVAADPGAAAHVVDRVDHVYKKGWLQPQVHQLLMQQLAPAQADADAGTAAGASRDPEEDATRIPDRRPAAATPDEATAPMAGEPPRGHAASELTVASPAERPSRGSADPTRSPARRESGSSTGRAMGSSTGSSTWAQHERSTVTREGPVGPRSLINQRFLLEERLGEGGMGVVYKALDRNKVVAEDPRPHVAIKILNEAFRKHPTAFVALQREARKAQELSHPNIVTVHDFDVDETRDGLAYMTMELLDGQELSELIEANRFGGLESEIALSYIADLATALAYAHEKGFVHCDFKPGNVFVTRHGDVKIFDFGIARALPSSLRKGATRDSFDAADLGAYTETYASPEVLDGEPPEQQDDVFALGLVAYELLTGRHPFERLRADKARERKLKPAPVVGISRRRRRALARALAFERDSRQRTAGAFLQEFSPVPVRHWAYAGTAVVALVAAYVGIVEPWIEQWLRAQAFERLPVEQQQAFTTSIEQGRVGLDMGNDGLPAALEFFSRAFEIHPYDARAVAGLEEVADRILAMQLNEDDLRANVRAFYCQEYLATYDGVVRQCGELFGPGTCTDPERVCNGR